MVNINLVPKEIKDRIGQAKYSANVFSICLIVVFLFVVSGVLAMAANTMVLEPELATVKEDIGQNTKDLTTFAALENKALFLNDRAKTAVEIEQKRPVWSQIIQGLINSVPQEVQFASITADATKSPNFVLEGFAKTERDIISFKDKLEASEFFKNVAFKSSSAEEKPVETPAPAPAAPAPTTTDASQTPAVTTPTPVPVAVAPVPTEKRVSFSLEFELEKYFLSEVKK